MTSTPSAPHGTRDLPGTSHPARDPASGSAAVEVSIVIPCLNESETLESCIRQAQEALENLARPGEIIVADNGSVDDSVAIAERCGASVVHVERKGYGSALMRGIESARGRFIVIGDADRSYDFREIRPFVQRMSEGYDLVLGNRFKGRIHRGAMPWHHRVIGNPLLTRALNVFYGAPVGDAHCGMRALTRQAYQQLNLGTTGMEFASEMIVKAALGRLKLCEIPISYRPDGRSRRPHLRSFRDGWRHLRFLLLYSPRWLFAIPGMMLLVVGLTLNAVLFPGPVHVGRVVFDVHMMLLGTLLALLGFQVLFVAAFAQVFAVREAMLPRGTVFERVASCFTLERGIGVGSFALLAGLALLLRIAMNWVRLNLGPLDLESTMRPAIAGMMLVVLGVETIFASFFLSILGFDNTSSPFPIRRRDNLATDTTSSGAHGARQKWTDLPLT